ncbi:unnamed protein product [marine sediment metagenome]|uniref:Uncharacterized protein n=1 Tax=marine sediment metagenome TaxID=412755 RepID=X1A763_9ZZZZ
MNDKLCICGLDYRKPLPEIFEWPPIVGAYPPGEYCCHVCGAITKTDTNKLFRDPESHNEGCKFGESLKNITNKGN